MEIFIDCVVIFGMIALTIAFLGFRDGINLAASDSDVPKEKSNS